MDSQTFTCAARVVFISLLTKLHEPLTASRMRRLADGTVGFWEG